MRVPEYVETKYKHPPTIARTSEVRAITTTISVRVNPRRLDIGFSFLNNNYGEEMTLSSPRLLETLFTG
jgi:hypothetical protein